MSEWRDAPPQSYKKNPVPPSHLRLQNNFTKRYEKKVFKEKKKTPVLSNCLSVLILYFNAVKFSIKLSKFYFIYFTVSVVSQRDKYEVVTKTHPFKNT